MRKELRNWFHNCKVRDHEWNLDVFMKGPLCSEADLCQIDVFTADDAKEIERLESDLKNPFLTEVLRKSIESEAMMAENEARKYLFGLLRNPKYTEENEHDLTMELTRLYIKKDTKRWVGKLCMGRVSIDILVGWTCADCSEYEEILRAEGDEVLVENVIKAAAATQIDKEMMLSSFAAMRKEVEYKMSKCEIHSISPGVIIFEPKDEKPLDLSAAH